MHHSLVRIIACGMVVAGTGRTAGEAAMEDPYLAYIRTAPEFQPVRQDREFLIGRWDTWIYMPWRFRWTIGTGEAGGRFCRDYGFNGGFTDHGDGPFEWLERWNLRFYNDHTAGKGYLYLRGANRKANFKAFQTDPRAIRTGADGPQPLDEALYRKLRAMIAKRVAACRRSPLRVAYALDDEISWGAFVTPIPWRLNEDDRAYADWLERYYGGDPPEPRYVTPEFTRRQLGGQLGELDFSPFLDRMTYNDSVWANFLGRLVEAANRADPDTPCGFVGGQAPNLWGGYDYAKLCRKIQFIEAYNLGSSQAIIRSFNPGNAMAQVTTHFHNDKRGVDNDIWQSWYYFAHGNRGMIGWVDGWFDGKTPRPWLAAYAPTLKEIGGVQGSKLTGARWLHDGVALYYSHPSIQVSWCLDSEAHGRTWVNRGSDHKLGTSHNVRAAWEHLLTDSGIQYDFLAYDRVVREGVPTEYKVLILPACYALSDMEAERITAFCERGGTVIADFAAGTFDQHGTGRKRGALDRLFGIRHDGTETAADFFADRLWVETDQDRGFYYKTYRELLSTLDCRMAEGYAVAERRLPLHSSRAVGRGRAVYINLSPQRYLQYREEGTATDALRNVFMRHVRAGGAEPRLKILGNGKRPVNCEATYWRKGDRTFVFVVQKATVSGGAMGGGGAEGLRKGVIPIDLEFAKTVRNVVDERSGERLGDGKVFSRSFDQVSAVLLSFER